MKNRSWSIRVMFAAVIVVTFTGLCSPSSAFPAERRTLNFVDRIVRANPLRTLAQYLSRKLFFNFYYPPQPQEQLVQQSIQSQALFYLPGSGVPTHYTKMPTILSPVYYTPSMAMIPPFAQQQTQGLLGPQKYVLHGISYPVPFPPQQQQYQTLQNNNPLIEPAMSSYQSPVVVQEGIDNQNQQLPFPQSFVPYSQSGGFVNELQTVHHDSEVTQTQQQPSSTAHSESSHHASDNSLVTYPTIVSSAETINEDDSSSSNLLSLPQFPELSENVHMQINGYEDAASADDMIKIFVLKPKDMERLVSSSEDERKELAKEYRAKYIDIEQGPEGLELDSPGQLQTQTSAQNDDTCIEPMCDTFLKKLIPELLSSSNIGQNGFNDPIVIVKNSSTTSFKEIDPFLKNHRLEYTTTTTGSNAAEPKFTIMKSIEGNGESAIENYQGQHSTIKQQRVRVHFPRKKFLSAKINSTALKTFESSEKRNESALSLLRRIQANENRLHQSSSIGHNYRKQNSTFFSSRPNLSDMPVQTLIPKPRRLNIGEQIYPYNGYGLNTMAEPILTKYHDFYEQDGENRDENKQTQFTAGILFNDSKVS